MASCINTHIRTDLDPVSDYNEGGIENGQTTSTINHSTHSHADRLMIIYRLGEEKKNSLPIQKTIPSNNDITSIIWPKRGLNEGARANTPDQSLQTFEARFVDLLDAHGSWIEVIVLGC